MKSFEIDLEILYTIKKGYHNFNKIWDKVKGKIGSKQTFSKHLALLVEEGAIHKGKKYSEIKYELGGDITVYEVAEVGINKLKRELKTIENKSTKINDNKKLLKKFVNDTNRNLTWYSTCHFNNLMFQRISDNYVKTYAAMNNMQLEIFDELIKTRMEILDERDHDLYEMFIQLVLSNTEQYI